MTQGGTWDVEFYEDENGREPCRDWIEDLSREKRLALETALEYVLAVRGLDVIRTEFGKALGKGCMNSACAGPRPRSHGRPVPSWPGRLSETEAILLRVFFCTSGSRIILLLSGYDKAKTPLTAVRTGRSPRPGAAQGSPRGGEEGQGQGPPPQRLMQGRTLTPMGVTTHA